MVLYVLKRILWGLVSLWLIITLTFLLMHSIPGGPFDSDAIEKMERHVRANLEAKFGLDRPPHERYVLYVTNLLRGELGVSINYSPRTVNQIVKQRLPVSARIGIFALLLALLGGVGLGTWAALNHNRWQDQTMKVVSTIGIALPSFILATLMLYFFAVRLGWFRTFGLNSMRDMVLPAAALAGGSIAFLSRLTRSSLLEVIRQDYIRTARAKGLPRHTVIYKHAFRNALIPIVTYVASLIAALITGSLVVERIFVLPGIGGEMVNAVGNRDYMMILGLTTVYASLLVAAYIVVDVLYVLIDPRVRFE